MPESAPHYLAGYDLAELRARRQREPWATSYAATVARVHRIAEADRLDSQEPPYTNTAWCHSNFVTPGVLDAGVVYALDGDPVALAHVRHQIAKMANVWADPPASMLTWIARFRPTGKQTTYFSSAQLCMAATMCRDGIPPAEWQTLLEMVRRCYIDDNCDAEYIFTHYNAGHNAVATHVISAAICALMLGAEAGHPDTEKAIALGIDACELLARWGFDDQGVPYEGPMYGFVTVEWVYLYADLLRRHGREDLLAMIPKLALIADACAKMLLPDLSGLPGFEDVRGQRFTFSPSGPYVSHVPLHWLPLTAAAYDRPQDLVLHREALPPATMDHRDMLWWDGVASARSLRDLGLPTCFVGEGTAVAVMRSDWQADAVYASVHGQGRSRSAPDHGHSDAGHVTIYVGGEALAWDSAYFNITEDQHSVILVDDTPYEPGHCGNMYSGHFASHGRHALLDYVTVDAAAAKGCIWSLRTVLFVRQPDGGSYLVLMDNTNVDNGMHSYKWQLQCPPTATATVTEPDRATVQGATARLDCTFAWPQPEDFPTAPHSFRAWVDDHRCADVDAVSANADIAHPRLVGQLDGPNCNLLTVISPRRNADDTLVVRVEPQPRLFQVFVEHGDCIDQIIYAPDHGRIRLPGVHITSEAALIRRDRAGTVRDHWSLDGGVREVG